MLALHLDDYVAIVDATLLLWQVAFIDGLIDEDTLYERAYFCAYVDSTRDVLDSALEACRVLRSVSDVAAIQTYSVVWALNEYAADYSYDMYRVYDYASWRAFKSTLSLIYYDFDHEKGKGVQACLRHNGRPVRNIRNWLI
jgi:hypothetical protein